ncbi:RNA-binding protein Nob1 [Sarcoptes scabiei]|uniref:Uncharacterized protein n=1 Tax=Sarcoptes scabiei TaxID=52283 RepID=A0A131ZVQ5_SARSC|nr:hypothetical protein QR98_0011390 [Sarcoptes scabiei]UXI18899.1 RNA-binding protein Nob1 [Sarcoptes scabiei]
MKLTIWFSLFLILIWNVAMISSYGHHGGHYKHSGHKLKIKHVWKKHYDHDKYGHGYGHGKKYVGHSKRYQKMYHHKGKKYGHKKDYHGHKYHG